MSGLRANLNERHPIAAALSTVDHTAIGVRYMITALLFFGLAGIEALFIRIQLATAENGFLSPDIYNQFFTMHGTTMVFYFAAPVLFGFSSFLVPLMIGARNIAFPRLNAFGYWVFLFSGLFMYSSFLVGMVPDGGWWFNPPLASPRFSPGLNLDFWILGLIFLSISFTVNAVILFVTIFKMRAPEMSLSRMPLFVWSILVASFVVIFAMLFLDSANILLVLERKFGLLFFQSDTAGTLFWQRLLGVVRYAGLYLIFLPAAGIISEIVGTFSRRPVLGDTLLKTSMVAAGILDLGLPVVQLFGVGNSPVTANLFNMLLAIPPGIMLFTWLAALLTGRPVWSVPLMWVGGFIFLFGLGGLLSLVLPASSGGQPVNGSYIDVAAIHSLLVGGAVFPMAAGFTYWFPKISGRLLNERLGKIHFWLFFIGANITFLPMFILGLEGMPQNMYTYRPGLGWDSLNLIATIGGMILAEGVLIFIVNVIRSLSRGKLAGDNPWDGRSLEWAAASPPGPTHAQPEPAIHLPVDRSMPFWLAASLLVVFLGLLLSQYWVAGIGAALTIAMVLIWVWPISVRKKNI